MKSAEPSTFDGSTARNALPNTDYGAAFMFPQQTCCEMFFRVKADLTWHEEPCFTGSCGRLMSGVCFERRGFLTLQINISLMKI